MSFFSDESKTSIKTFTSNVKSSVVSLSNVESQRVKSSVKSTSVESSDYEILNSSFAHSTPKGIKI